MPPPVLGVELPVRRLTRAVRGGPVIVYHATTTHRTVPEPFGVLLPDAQGGAAVMTGSGRSPAYRRAERLAAFGGAVRAAYGAMIVVV